MNDPAAMAREVIDANFYMTLGTSEASGAPRVSPVYFTHDAYRDFYWVSGPDAHHSVNVRARPPAVAVIFDSTAAVGEGRAVYLTGTVSEIAASDLPARCELAFANIREGGARPFTPEELSGDADLRLYVLTAARHEIHLRGRDPSNTKGIDTRREVSLA